MSLISVGWVGLLVCVLDGCGRPAGCSGKHHGTNVPCMHLHQVHGRCFLYDVHACATSPPAPVDPGLTNCSMGATVVADIAASVTCLLGMPAAEYQSKASFAERVEWTGHAQVRAHRGW